MPPENEGNTLSEDEIAVLRQWIAAGAPPFSPPGDRTRPFIDAAMLLQAIHDDLETVPQRDRPFARYFTITHLYNAGISEDELQTYRHGLAKLVNSLSWDPEITVPRPVEKSRTVYRIDLRHYKWTPGIWNQVLAQYPYGLHYESGTARAIREATGCELPHVRADWFVFAASRPPLYHDILQMPPTDRELERELNVDVAANIRDERVARAGFTNSGVSQNNRMIERHKTGYGAYWKSYDFADNRDRRNILQHPLGPGPAINTFLPDGGEIIFNLPNGLQAYLLVNGQGERIDRGPTQIVRDPRPGDGTVVNGISCMSCHVKGMKENTDVVRDHVEKNPASFPGEVEPIRALYPPRDKFAALMRRDAERFVTAVQLTGAPQSNTDPIVALASRFEWELDAPRAAAEVDLSATEFLKKMQAAPPELARVFGPLQIQGGTVKRQVMESAFARLAAFAGTSTWKPSDGAAKPPTGNETVNPAIANKEITNTIGMRLRWIPAGKFTMGSPGGESGRRNDERPHEVEISRPFFMGVFPVTQEEYQRVMGVNPSGFSAQGADRGAVVGRDTRLLPVERVSWEDAVKFCERLSNLPEERRAGRRYRLPTEAEWEYACRAGTTEAFHTGRTLTAQQANFNGKAPTTVGSFPANAFGLRDMHGNVWQWCGDWYDSDAYTTSPPRDPTGPATGNFRVLRGGSWQESSKDCRSAVRHHSLPGYPNHAYGFRIVQTDGAD